MYAIYSFGKHFGQHSGHHFIRQFEQNIVRPQIGNDVGWGDEFAVPDGVRVSTFVWH